MLRLKMKSMTIRSDEMKRGAFPKKSREDTRQSLLSRLALFSSKRAWHAIFRGQVNMCSDLTDILELWDRGPSDPGFDLTTFSDIELDSLRKFDGVFTQFMRCHMDYDRDLPTNHFFYTESFEPPEDWLRLREAALAALEAFSDFDLAGWEESGFFAFA